MNFSSSLPIKAIGNPSLWLLVFTNKSNCRVNPAALSPASPIAVSDERIGSSEGTDINRISVSPEITVKRLLKSWAIPLAS